MDAFDYGYLFGYGTALVTMAIAYVVNRYVFGRRERTWRRARVECSFRGMKRRDIQREVAESEERGW